MPNPSFKAYRKAILGLMALYVPLLLLATAWVRGHRDSPARFVVVLLPMVPVAFIPFAVLRFARRLDELARRMQFEALALAFPLTAVVMTSYGFLQIAGMPPVSWVWAWPVMGVCWTLGLLRAQLKYR